MRDLSLHLLDIMENALTAGAGRVRVTVAEDGARDVLELTVEDNGPGLPVSVEQALDPFYTTKRNKRTGLGLSLFRAAAEQAGGELAVGRSELGGVAVRAALRLSHVDRAPLGDVAATLFAVLCTNPGLALECRVVTAAGERLVSAGPEAAGGGSFEEARRFAERAAEALGALTAARGSFLAVERSG